jgi:hypothetical protein
VKDDAAVLWRLDARCAGVRTAACGPGMGEKYRVRCQEVRLEGVFGRDFLLSLFSN